MESMRKAYARDEIRELMEAREKAERDRISDLACARREGLSQGLSQGRKEIALQLRQMGMPPEEIVRATGLPLNELP